MARRTVCYTPPDKRTVEQLAEAAFHKKIQPFLSKKDQGRTMGAWRELRDEFPLAPRKPEPPVKDPYKVGYERGYEGGQRLTDCPYDAQQQEAEYTDWHQGFDHGAALADQHEEIMRGKPSTPHPFEWMVIFAAIGALLVFAWQRGFL